MTIVTWDHKEQPDWAKVNVALAEDISGFVFEVESGTDHFAIVIAPSETTQEQAKDYYDEHQFDFDT